jgi:hypothetical protein
VFKVTNHSQEPFKNLGSLGLAVMNRQFWRQFDLLGKSCRPPAVQLLA